MKRLIPLALVALALTAVPVALADDGAQPQQAGRGARIEQRLQMIEQRFDKRCGANAADQRCAEFAQKLVQRLQTLDGKVQDRLKAKCSSSSADQRCSMLTDIDAKLQALIQKLGGKAAPSSSESAFDQAAAGLGQLKP